MKSSLPGLAAVGGDRALVVLRHNVRVQVTYSGGLPDGEATARAGALARTVLLRIPGSH